MRLFAGMPSNFGPSVLITAGALGRSKLADDGANPALGVGNRPRLAGCDVDGKRGVGAETNACVPAT
jgi:hypothetical protein